MPKKNLKLNLKKRMKAHKYCCVPAMILDTSSKRFALKALGKIWDKRNNREDSGK